MNHAQLTALGRALRLLGEHGESLTGDTPDAKLHEVKADIKRALDLLEDSVTAAAPTTRCAEHPNGPVDENAPDLCLLCETRRRAARRAEINGPGARPRTAGPTPSRYGVRRTGPSPSSAGCRSSGPVRSGSCAARRGGTGTRPSSTSTRSAGARAPRWRTGSCTSSPTTRCCGCGAHRYASTSNRSATSEPRSPQQRQRRRTRTLPTAPRRFLRVRRDLRRHVQHLDKSPLRVVGWPAWVARGGERCPGRAEAFP